MSVTLGVHRWSFPACSVRESAAIAAALGFSFLDLGSSFDHDPVAVAREPKRSAAELGAIATEHDVALRDAFLHFDPKFSTNHPDDAIRRQHLATARGYFAFAAAAGLHGVSFSPGVVWPGEARSEAARRSAEVLSELVTAGGERGLAVRIEPHVGSVTPTPETTLDLLALVPGLSLTLDPSHFLAVGITPWELAPLVPHATHWHLRQARPGSGQARFDDGTIDLAQLVRSWREHGYRGGVCLEYVHSSWMGLDGVDCLSETVRMRDALRSALAADGELATPGAP